MIRFPRKSIPLLSTGVLLSASSPAPDFYRARNLSAKPFNQLDLAGTACGPADLLNSSRFGNPAQRNLSETPVALDDRGRIRAIARGPAMHVQRHSQDAPAGAAQASI
jgi:hypothetical protein